VQKGKIKTDKNFLHHSSLTFFEFKFLVILLLCTSHLKWWVWFLFHWSTEDLQFKSTWENLKGMKF